VSAGRRHLQAPLNVLLTAYVAEVRDGPGNHGFRWWRGTAVKGRQGLDPPRVFDEIADGFHAEHFDFVDQRGFGRVHHR